jgi:hypothetical protein
MDRLLYLLVLLISIKITGMFYGIVNPCCFLKQLFAARLC